MPYLQFWYLVPLKSRFLEKWCSFSKAVLSRSDAVYFLNAARRFSGPLSIMIFSSFRSFSKRMKISCIFFILAILHNQLTFFSSLFCDNMYWYCQTFSALSLSETKSGVFCIVRAEGIVEFTKKFFTRLNFWIKIESNLITILGLKLQY